METIIGLAIAVAVLGLVLAPAELARRRLFADAPQLGQGILLGAAVVGLLITVILVRVRAERHLKRKFDTVFAGMCATPPAGDATATAFHELACSPDVRTADLRGASEYQGPWAHIAVRGDKLVIFTPRPDVVPTVAPGRAYQLWLLDAGGNVIDHAPLERTLSALLLDRPKLADAVKAVLTVEPLAAPTTPSGQLVAQGALAPL